jgi:FkbH-like protein
MENLKYSEILEQNTLLAKEVEGNVPYRITILSNIICNQLKSVLEFNLRKSKLNPKIQIGNYDNIIQDSYNCKSEQLVVIHYDLVNIIDKLDDFIEDLTDEQVDLIYQAIQSEIDLLLVNLKHIPALVFNSFTSGRVYSNAILPSNADQLARKLNEYLYSKKEINLQVLDINITLAKVGLSAAFDSRMFYLSKNPYTISFWKEYAYELSCIVFKYTGKLKKAIIFDCDNTLWKGILGEDGLTGIDMSPESKAGQVFNRVQRIAVWLSKQGVIIGLCSKNNAADVEKVLAEHADIKLKNEHIVIRKINWQNKASNLREIASELNIGLDSFVFVDDSSFEVNLIKEQIPEILTFQVPVAIHEYPRQLLTLVERFFYLSGSLADIDKTMQYKVQSLRNEEMAKYQTLEDYLASIEIEISINENDFSQVDRIAQLTQKTNQFNLTTQRYTENQIEFFMKSPDSRVYSISVKDKFGDSGLTGVIIVRKNNDLFIIDSLLMSCRIMGRNIEQAIMNFLIKSIKQSGGKVIEASFFPTIKNKTVSNFYDESGFTLVNQENDIKEYKLNIFEYKPYDAAYIKIKQ